MKNVENNAKNGEKKIIKRVHNVVENFIFV